TATAVEVTDDLAHELLGNDDLDLHDRLDDHRAGLWNGSLERHRARDLEGHLVRVDLVLRAVHDGGPQVDHRVARDDAVLHGFFDPLLDGLLPILGEPVPADPPLVLEPGAALERLEVDDDVAVLALAARLTDVAALALRGLGQRLAVRDLRTADVRGDAEFTKHAVDDDLEVQLAHARDERLAGLLVGVDAERRVLLGETRERQRHLLLVGLRLRLDRDLHDRL